MPGADETSARRPLVRAYAEPEQARAAIESLLKAGVPADEISILARSTAEAEQIERATGASDDLESSTERPHRFGDALSWLGRVESWVVPGFGSVLGSGNVWQDIAPPADSRGAITGLLVGLGIDVDTAERYEQAVARGELLLVVHGPRVRATTAQLEAILPT
jgi:hypothetical protein